MQKAMPTRVEVLYKTRSARMQDVQSGIVLIGEDSDLALADKQNEGKFPIDFNPSDPTYDLFYRATNENGIGKIVALISTIVRVTLDGALNVSDLTFDVSDPGNSETFRVEDVLLIEDELMIIESVTPGAPTSITVEARGVHGTDAASHINSTTVELMKYTVPHNSITVAGIVNTALPGAPAAFSLSNASGAEGNGIEFRTELPLTGSKSITYLQIQTRKGGANLTTNGEFADDTDWTKGAGWTISAGIASKAAGSASDLEQNQAVTDGISYQVKFTVIGRTAGTIFARLAGTSGTSRSTNAAFVETIKAGSGSEPKLEFVADASFDGDIDDVSVLQTFGDDVRDTTGLGVIQDTGADGLITQGGLTLITSVTLDNAYAGKTVYTHEGIDITNGEVTFASSRPILSAIDIGGGEWEITVSSEYPFTLRNGAEGASGVVNFIVADDWANLSVPTYLSGLITRSLSIIPGDISNQSNFYDFLKTADIVFARARFANFNGAGKWMYWDGIAGDIDKTKAVTFAPALMDATAAITTASFSTAADDAGVGGGFPVPVREDLFTDTEILYLQSGETIYSSSAYDGPAAGANLVDSTKTFITDNKVRVGDIITNQDDGSTGTVLSIVSETELETVLTGGTNNFWTPSNDFYDIVTVLQVVSSPDFTYDDTRVKIKGELISNSSLIFHADFDGGSGQFTFKSGSSPVTQAILSKTAFTLGNLDLGGITAGRSIVLRRNTNSGNLSAGFTEYQDLNGNVRPLWVDATGDVRVNTSGVRPNNANDTSGIEVGEQTSWWKLKKNITEFFDYNLALQAILATPLYSFDMKGKHYNAGFVIFEKDRKSWFSKNDNDNQIPCLDGRQVPAYLAASIKVMHKRARYTNIALGLVITLMLVQWLFF